MNDSLIDSDDGWRPYVSQVRAARITEAQTVVVGDTPVTVAAGMYLVHLPDGSNCMMAAEEFERRYRPVEE